MRIGFIGAGKLGLPVALAVEDAGHEVCVYDQSEAVKEIVYTRTIPYQEVGAQELLSKANLVWTSAAEIAQLSFEMRVMQARLKAEASPSSTAQPIAL